MNEEKKTIPPWAYLLGGAAVGAALGVLFAPKKGSVLRAELKDSMARAKERTQEAIAAVKEKVHLVKS